jgi:hypothetical protein
VCFRPLRGRFVVLEAEYGAFGEVKRFALDFVQRCGDESAPALSGSIRYHSTLPIGTPPPTSTVTSTPTPTSTPTDTSSLPLTATPTSTPSMTLIPSPTASPAAPPTPTPTAVPCPLHDFGSSVPNHSFYLGNVPPAAPGSCAGDKRFAITYRFTAPSAGRFVFDTDNSREDTVLVARAAGCDGNELACNDDAEQPGGPSRISVSLAAGGEIVVSVGLPSDQEAVVVLNVNRDDGGVCAGDCGGDARVAVDELITLVNAALDRGAPAACVHGIPPGARVDISLLIEAVGNTLIGCPD